MITGMQIRGACALLGWDSSRVAEKAVLTTVTIQRAESAEDIPDVPLATLAAIQSAFERAGVEFITNGSGAEVRLRRYAE